MTDIVNEWVVNGLREFDGKELGSALTADLDLKADASEEDKKKEELQEGPDRRDADHPRRARQRGAGVQPAHRFADPPGHARGGPERAA